MDLEKTINDEIKSAMISKNEVRLRSLRAIKAALLLAKTEKGSSPTLSEDQEIKILQKLVKQRKDSAQIYKDQNRPDLLQIEEEEIKVIEEFLPAQLSEDEIRSVIQKIIDTTHASSIKDMGKVMGLASQSLAGKAENKTIANIVRELLSI